MRALPCASRAPALRVCASRRLRRDRRASAARAAAPQRRPENADGDFYVDDRCIDCDACRWIAPATFARVGGLSAVVAQPPAAGGDGAAADERLRALQAMLACPTASIRSVTPPPDVRQAHASFPMAVHEAPGVYYLGFHSPKSFGAASYLVLRPEGNIMVDSPRFSLPLARALTDFGGVRFVFLTHRDDVADAAAWAAHFGAQRVIHEADVTSATADAEVKLAGSGPWAFPHGEPWAFPHGEQHAADVAAGGLRPAVSGDDALVLHVPGHTAGSCALLHRPSGSLFSGDTLAHSPGLGRLTIFRRFNWHSVEMQLEAVRGLLDHDWRHLLPGHGRRVHFTCKAAKDAAIKHLLSQEAELEQGAR